MRLLQLLLLFSVYTYSQTKVEATLYLQNNKNLTMDILGIQNDSLVLSGQLKNGTSKIIRMPKSVFTKVVLQNGQELDLSLQEWQPDSLHTITNQNALVPQTVCAPETIYVQSPPAPSSMPEIKPEVDSTIYMYISTEPEGAALHVYGERVAERSPGTVTLPYSDEILVEARWTVDQFLWAGKKVVKPGAFKAKDTVKVFIQMKKVRPVLTITTTPAHAEIYVNAQAHSYNYPRHFSPYTFRDLEPKQYDILLKHKGYADSLISILIDPMEVNTLDIALRPLEDPAQKEMQNSFLALRKKHQQGEILIRSSIGFFVSSALLQLAAKKQYERAQSIKDGLQTPGVKDGPNYQSKVDANHTYHDRGQKYQKAAIGMLIAGTALCGVGFTLYF